MTTVSVDFGAKYGHDFHQIGAELFHVWFVSCIIGDDYFDPIGLTNLENNFASEAEQTVLGGCLLYTSCVGDISKR